MSNQIEPYKLSLWMRVLRTILWPILWVVNKMSSYGLLENPKKQARTIALFRYHKQRLAHLPSQDLKDLRSAVRLWNDPNSFAMFASFVAVLIAVEIAANAFTTKIIKVHSWGTFLHAVPSLLPSLWFIYFIFAYFRANLRNDVKGYVEQCVESILEDRKDT